MQKRTFALFFVLASCFSLGYSQSSSEGGNIHGKVMDANEDIPLEYATISVYKGDSTLAEGGITDEEGNFEVEVEPGDYHMEVQFVAYKKQILEDITIDNTDESVDMGTIYLEQKTQDLDEVTVRQERSEMVIGVDRKTFNVGKDLTNTGNSAAEILDNIPTVSVDAEGNISLRGSGGVRLLIDGKPSGLVNSGDADALRALQGNMVERVEIITNPGAKYEAEGMAGIINIILKKEEREGVNGSFEGSAGYPERYQFGANVNFRREKINYFFNYGLRYEDDEGEGFSDQFFPEADSPFHTRIDRISDRGGWSNNLRGGADFFINELTTLTAEAVLDYDNENNHTDVHYKDFRDDNGEKGELYQETMRYDNEKEKEYNVEFSLNFEKQFDPDNKEHKLNAFAQYILDDETEDSRIEEEIIEGNIDNEDIIYQSVLNEEQEENMMAEVEYVYPFSEDGKFEAGGRTEFRNINNPYKVENKVDGEWVNDPEYTNDFSYNENVSALYAQGANRWGDISIQAGLRGEFSIIETYLKQNDETNERSYLDVFPSLHTTYHFSDHSSWQISYSSRINRPHFWDLNPFSGLSDSRNLRRGNPDLDPEYTDAYESGYAYNPGSSSYYAGIYYRYTTGVEENINFVTDDGITISEPRNMAERHDYGAEANISTEPFEWWHLSGNINFFRRQTEGSFENNGNVQDLSSDTYSWDTRINSRMRWENDLSFQTTFFYRGEQETTQGLRKPFYMLNTSLSKDILQGDGTITLNVRDVLNSRKFRHQIKQPDLISTNEFRWSQREFRLSFIYKLNQNNRDQREERGQSGGPESGGEEMGF